MPTNLYARSQIYLEHAIMLIFLIKEICLHWEVVMESFDVSIFSRQDLTEKENDDLRKLLLVK